MGQKSWLRRILGPGAMALRARGVPPQVPAGGQVLAGLAAALALAQGDDFWRHLGAGFFLLCLLFGFLAMQMAAPEAEDRAASGPPSTASSRSFFAMVSALCAGAALWGLGFGLTGASRGQLAVIMGLAAGLVVAVLLILIDHVRAGGSRRSAKLQGLGGIAPEDLLLAIPVMIWLGLADALLSAVFLLSAAGLGFILVHYRHDLFSKSPSDP